MSVAMGHVGITVPSLDAAVAWYREVLGATPLGALTEVGGGDGHGERMAAAVFGGLVSFRQAHLRLADGVALELFEFREPPTRPPEEPFAFWRTGVFHVCVVDPAIASLVQRIRTSGGRQRTAIWEIRPGEPYRMCYCEDPFGTVIEVYSHGHDATYGTAA